MSLAPNQIGLHCGEVVREPDSGFGIVTQDVDRYRKCERIKPAQDGLSRSRGLSLGLRFHEVRALWGADHDGDTDHGDQRPPQPRRCHCVRFLRLRGPPAVHSMAVRLGCDPGWQAPAARVSPPCRVPRSVTPEIHVTGNRREYGRAR
jgi:hypothetical protein